MIPVSAVIATRNRTESLRRMLQSMAAQTEVPTEIIVVDASTDAATEQLCATEKVGEKLIRYIKSPIAGAAAQRNIGTANASHPFVWFLDDDVILEPDCLGRLWKAISGDERIGGVNAMIVNQSYRQPGRISRVVYALLNGRAERSYAGRCIGPAINFLPEDRDDLPEIVPIEWLNTTCTIYRAAALPNPPFSNHFIGYSLMEDLALSLAVGKTWQLANVRAARVFHDSQPGEHKAVAHDIVRMGLVNRYYIMTEVLDRRGVVDHAKFALLQLFTALSVARKPRMLLSTVKGQFAGIAEIIRGGKSGSKA
jgi:glycosyltransferase involved in cell wall biosynthesis